MSPRRTANADGKGRQLHACGHAYFVWKEFRDDLWTWIVCSGGVDFSLDQSGEEIGIGGVGLDLRFGKQDGGHLFGGGALEGSNGQSGFVELLRVVNWPAVLTLRSDRDVGSVIWLAEIY